MDIGPTFKGYIEDENDAVLVLQATLEGKLRHIPRRPYEVERRYLIVSGSIFVFIEEVSGIKRWTDGVSWSPSRISGKFLMYKELDKSAQPLPVSASRKRTSGASSSSSSSPSSPMLKMTSLSPNQFGGNHRKGIASASSSNGNSGSSSSGYDCPSISYQNFSPPASAAPPPPSSSSSLSNCHQHRVSKYTGFVKKTMSVRVKTGDMVSPETLHIVSYYSMEDVRSGKLIRPRDSLYFGDTKVSQELLVAVENTSLGSQSKSSSATAVSSPLVPGCANANGKMAFFDKNNSIDSTSTAGSMGEPQRQLDNRCNTNSNYQSYHRQQQAKFSLPSIQQLPSLRIPPLTSVYNNNDNDNNTNNNNNNSNTSNNNNDNDNNTNNNNSTNTNTNNTDTDADNNSNNNTSYGGNSNPTGAVHLPPYAKFTRLTVNPLQNHYLNHDGQNHLPSSVANSTTPTAPPSLPSVLNKINSGFYSFPPGYTYYGSSPHQNSGLFYPLPTATRPPTVTATHLPHPLTSTITTMNSPTSTTAMKNPRDLKGETSLRPNPARAPADAAD